VKTQLSVTALGAAKMRAAHLVMDDAPKVFQDDFALLFSGGRDGDSLQHEMDAALAEVESKIGSEMAKRIFQSSRALMLSRSRFTEDALRRAEARGIRHYVILGAGLDSFAWRHPEFAASLKIVEIDHPATQEWKRERLRELGIAQPINLTFLPIDFENQTLLDGLSQVESPLEEPIFFSWLGVTQYLTSESVFQTLREVASLPSGTELAFTFIVPPDLLSPEDRGFSAMAAKAAADRGEPWLSVFAPDELIRQVETFGFRVMEYFRPADSNQRYFSGRSDGLRVPDGEHLLLTEVGETARQDSVSELRF
jgi:methyltransferase (TIGR00027 family)